MGEWFLLSEEQRLVDSIHTVTCLVGTLWAIIKTMGKLVHRFITTVILWKKICVVCFMFAASGTWGCLQISESAEDGYA